jgi:sugar phosphate isomerase/epimerase
MMRWSFATIVLVPRGTWGKKPETEERRHIFDWAARTGFVGIEISPRWLDFHTSTSRELLDLRREVVDAGLVVSGLNISRCILTRTTEATSHWLRLTRSVEVAETLEAEIINCSLSMPTLPSPDRPPLLGRDVPETEFQRSVELVTDLAHRASRVGVKISLELHDDGLLDSADLCLRFMNQIQAPNVGVNPDLGNICRAGPVHDWEGALKLLAARTNCWHIKNYRQGEGAPLWDGDIDYNRALAIMRKSGYKGWVAIESYFGNVMDLQRRSLEYLKHLATSSA